MSLRAKLLLVALSILALPWAGWQFVRQMETLLRQGQEQALLASADALARGVAHEVQADAIKVPADQRDSLRMELAAEGLPAATGKGYELLDSLSGFGTTAQMFDAAQWRELESIARGMVASDGLRRFFDPAQHRWAASELEFVLPDGSLGRIDRLVEFDDEVWILDYKSGPGDAFAEAYASAPETLGPNVRANVAMAASITLGGLLVIAGLSGFA